MRDRLAAVGGELAIVTAPGEGTRVIGRIPLGQRLPRAVPPRRTARELPRPSGCAHELRMHARAVDTRAARGRRSPS